MTHSPPPLLAGQRKERLPDGETVIRLLRKTTSEGKISPDEFDLSSRDKASELQSISVWAVRLTSPEQAWEFMGEKKEAYSLFCSLNVDHIRTLCPEPDNKEVNFLNVVWDPLVVTQKDGNEIPDTRPGAEGHSGITGLMRPPGLPKPHFFSLRSQLADLANATLQEEIARLLGDNKSWHSHGRYISANTLQNDVRLKIEDYSINLQLRSLIRDYNDLLIEYIRRNNLTVFIHSKYLF